MGFIHRGPMAPRLCKCRIDRTCTMVMNVIRVLISVPYICIHSMFTDAVMANSVPQIIYKSCRIQKVVRKNRLASMSMCSRVTVFCLFVCLLML